MRTPRWSGRTLERSVSTPPTQYTVHLSNPHVDLATKNPVVFCHGLLGFDSVTIGPAIASLEVAHWRGIKEVLQSNGVDVLTTRVPATSSPIDRAQVLAKRISEVYPGRKIHLIGLSLHIPCCDSLCIHTQTLVWHLGHSMVSFHPSDVLATRIQFFVRAVWTVDTSQPTWPTETFLFYP